MSNDSKDKSIEEDEDINNTVDKSETKEKRPFAVLIIPISFVLAVAAAILAFQNYRTIKIVEQDSAYNGIFDGYNTELGRLNQAITSIQSKQQSIEQSLSSFQERQERNAQSLQRLYEKQTDGESQWSLTEVEYYINIANLRLTLEQDVDTALAALDAADNRLASLGAPALYNLRRRLAADMNTLRNIIPVDITGLSLQLKDLASRIDNLPLKSEIIIENSLSDSTVDITLPAWKQLLINIWYEFKGMFVITRTGNGSSATLLPNERYFLYQNLRLQLEGAKLALLHRDSDNLQQALQQVKIWLNDYFDTSDIGVINIIQTADLLSDLELDPVLPDISTSLDALRNYINNNADRINTESGTNIQ